MSVVAFVPYGFAVPLCCHETFGDEIIQFLGAMISKGQIAMYQKGMIAITSILVYLYGQYIRPSASFLAELSVSSPRKLIIFII